MEVADRDRLRGGSHLSLLASAVQRELGARHWTRTARRAGLALPGGISGCGINGGVLADSLVSELVEPQTNTLNQTKSRMTSPAGATDLSPALQRWGGRRYV